MAGVLVRDGETVGVDEGAYVTGRRRRMSATLLHPPRGSGAASSSVTPAPSVAASLNFQPAMPIGTTPDRAPASEVPKKAKL